MYLKRNNVSVCQSFLKYKNYNPQLKSIHTTSHAEKYLYGRITDHKQQEGITS